jgi:hypothetical protein
MRSDIADVISNCDACRRYTVGKEGYHPARDITASGPGVHLQIDLCVHLPASTEGHVALLVVIDVFTGFIGAQSNFGKFFDFWKNRKKVTLPKKVIFDP